MGIYFVDSLCRKCPHFGKQPCSYKINFYKSVKLNNPKYKLIHKCQQYRKLFDIGQTVEVDLYDEVLDEYGEVEKILAHKNVAGIIRGVNGCKYKIELFEPHVVRFRKGGLKKPEKGNVIIRCSKHARDIRPVELGKNLTLGDQKHYYYLWKRRKKGPEKTK